MKRKFLTALKFFIFLGLGVFLLWLITKDLTPQDKEDIINSLKGANYWWVIASVFLGISSHLSRAQRWRMLMRPMGYNPRFGVTFGAVMIGYLANLAFPRLGEVTKCGIINRYEKIPIDKLVGTMIAERAIDVISLLVVTALTLFLQFGLLRDFANEKIFKPFADKFMAGMNVVPILIGVGVILLILIYFLAKKFKDSQMYVKLKGLLLNVKEGLISVKDVDNIPMFIFHSIYIWFMYFAMVYVCFFTIPETSGYGMPVGLSILVFGSLAIMATPGGIGAYQAIVTETLTEIYKQDYTSAYAFSWIVWIAQTIMILIVGTLCLILLPVIYQPKQQNETSGSDQQSNI